MAKPQVEGTEEKEEKMVRREAKQAGEELGLLGRRAGRSLVRVQAVSTSSRTLIKSNTRQRKRMPLQPKFEDRLQDRPRRSSKLLRVVVKLLGMVLR